MDRQITPEQAEFVAAKTKEFFDYTMQCFDRARADGNNMLQWLFGVITGGLAAVGTLHSKGFFALGIGALVAVIAAAHAAMKLVTEMRSRQTMGPGNMADSLTELLTEPFPRMKWREARGMDDRIRQNVAHTESLTLAVDRARIRFANIPFLFVGGVLATYACQYFFPAITSWASTAAPAVAV